MKTFPSKTFATGREAYADDLARWPLYHDGSPRKTWADLADWQRASWDKNPTRRIAPGGRGPKIGVYVQIGTSDGYRLVGATDKSPTIEDAKAAFLAANPHLTPDQVYAATL